MDAAIVAFLVGKCAHLRKAAESGDVDAQIELDELESVLAKVRPELLPPNQ